MSDDELTPTDDKPMIFEVRAGNDDKTLTLWRKSGSDEWQVAASFFVDPSRLAFDEMTELAPGVWEKLREQIAAERPKFSSYMTLLPVAKQTASGTLSPESSDFVKRWLDGLSPEVQRAKAEAAKAAWQAQQDVWIARIVTALGFPADWQLTEVQRADLYALIDEVYDYGLSDDD